MVDSLHSAFPFLIVIFKSIHFLFKSFRDHSNQNYLINKYYHTYLTAFSKDFLTFYKCKSIKFYTL